MWQFLRFSVVWWSSRNVVVLRCGGLVEVWWSSGGVVVQQRCGSLVKMQWSSRGEVVQQRCGGLKEVRWSSRGVVVQQRGAEIQWSVTLPLDHFFFNYTLKSNKDFYYEGLKNRITNNFNKEMQLQCLWLNTVPIQICCSVKRC